MTITERIILMCFIRDWYLEESTRSRVKTARRFVGFSQTVQEVINGLRELEGLDGEGDGDA